MVAGLPDRAEQMRRSLSGAAVADGASEAEVAGLARAFDLAMEPRVGALADDHHPAYLHPGRSPLILLRDVGDVDVAVLVVATLHESTDAFLRVPPAEIEGRVGAAAVGALDAIPLPGDERLVERLLALGPGLSLAALAERLDQLRHLHLREELAELWAETFEETVSAWLPFSQRVHPRLATRYAHWARTFARRI